MHSSIRRKQGQGMVEYIIIVAIVAVAAIAVYGLFGDRIHVVIHAHRHGLV